MIIDGATTSIAVLWSFLMIILGTCFNHFGNGKKLERIYRYVVKDEDNDWVHYSCYEDLEDEKELISKELEKERKLHEFSKSYAEDYKKQVSALETQIECLKAEVCTLKNPQLNKKE